MVRQSRPFAVVTGASSGIGFELAKQCVKHGYDLLVAADEPSIEDAARQLAVAGAVVDPLMVDLATIEGVDQLYSRFKAGRSTPCSPTPAEVWDTHSSIRTSTTSDT